MNNEQCPFCGSPATETHHMIFGKNRQNSEKYKELCCCRLCNKCHYELHNSNEHMAMTLRKVAQSRFESKYGHEKFMEVFGRNYL